MTAHEREQTAVLRSDGIDLPPAGQEVVIHGTDDVKTVSHDACLREMLFDQRPVAGRQIHTHHLYPIFLFEARQVVFERGLAAAQHHIVDFVVLQIAEGRRIPVPAREEVLINAQNLRTSAADALPGQQLQIPLKPTLNRGARQTLAFGQPTPADAIEMLLADTAPERFGRPQPRLKPRKAPPEAAAAGPALRFPRL